MREFNYRRNTDHVVLKGIGYLIMMIFGMGIGYLYLIMLLSL
jgi:hypothetical protein